MKNDDIRRNGATIRWTTPVLNLKKEVSICVSSAQTGKLKNNLAGGACVKPPRHQPVSRHRREAAREAP